ncbi:zinc finger BED domain-containing protein DAYSLEEPER isoform X2 [Spinacia oleracea]|nr:zinc finger BED domain-containing protein DAYSLEEPER-like isoform X2 [Spinacia oleracea]
MVRIGNASTPQAPTEDEWSKLEKICALLRPFDAITKRFSGRNYPTANLYLMHVWTIESLIRSYCNHEDETLNSMGKKMKDKFDKYWESYSMILSLAAIFDPRLKLQYVKFCFTQLDARSAEYKTEQVKESLFKLFEEYATNGNVQDNVPGARCESNHLAAFSNFENSSFQGRTQLDDYLGEHKLDPLAELDVLQWWKVNEIRFPQVAKMARELLSIPITTVASESAFSLGSRILTKWRASLLPDNAEVLITTRSWLIGYDVEKGDNSLDDGIEIPLLQDPNIAPQEISDDEYGEDEEDF